MENTSRDKPTLVILGGESKGKVIPIEVPAVRIGRNAENNIIVSDPRISGIHAEIFQHDKKFYIKDLESTNGTFVNSQPVAEAELNDGDRIELGDILLVFKIGEFSDEDIDKLVSEPDIEMVFEENIVPETSLEMALTTRQIKLASRDVSLIDDMEQLALIHTRLATLYEILQKLNVLENVDRLLELILEQIFKEMEVDRAVLMFKNEATGKLESRATKSRHQRVGKETIHISQTIIDNVVNRGEAVLTRDAQHDDRFEATESIIKMGIRSAMCVPLKTEGSLLGILYIDKLSHIDIYTEDDLEFLVAICNQAAVSIKNAQLFTEVQKAQDEIKQTNEKLEDANEAYWEANQLLEKAYIKLRETQEQLIQSEKISSLGQMVARLAHDLNNPLGAILGYSQLLESKLAEEGNTQEMVRKLQSATSICMGIINDLLSFARKEDMQPEPADINKLIEESIELQMAQNDKNWLEVETNFNQQLPKVSIDPIKMMRVFNNIISNSIQAMSGQSQGKIRIQTDYDDNWVEISIKDDGPGISKEDLTKIFDPFFTTKGHGKGTGLGLSTCFGVVKAHGGEIIPESEPGCETTFRIRLPRSRTTQLKTGST